MKLRPLPIAVAVLAAAIIALLGYSLLLGLLIGLSLGVLIGFAVAMAESRTVTPQSQALPAYDPNLAQQELEAAYISVKRALHEEDTEVDAQIYQSLIQTLRYLPASSAKGGTEVWNTVQRELLNPTLSDLRSSEDRTVVHKRITQRCDSLPLTLQALASTLLPENTLALDSADGTTYYLDNLHAMPAIKKATQGNSIDRVGVGQYFRVGNEVFLAKERFLYRCGSDSWHEVLGESLRDGSIKALEWEVDDHQLEILLQTGPTLSLNELGVQLTDLKKMDDREEGKLTFRGNTFHYDESDKATCQASTSSEVESFYYYDFINPTTKEVLGIERWGSETKGYIMRPVSIKELEIFTV